MSGVNPYPLSKDYQKLLEHLKRGELIVAFVDYSFYKLKRDGCAKMVEFDWDLQYAEDPVDLLSLAEKYGSL